MSLADSDYTDIVLGPDYAEVRITANASMPALDVTEQHLAELACLRALCNEKLDKFNKPEFALTGPDGTRFRVTTFTNAVAAMEDETVFVLAKAPQTFGLSALKLPVLLRDHLMRPDLRGLVLFCGEQRAGKTTHAGSIYVSRLTEHGGIGLALQDPTELVLSGVFGKGRGLNLEVSRFVDGYEETLVRALRSRARNYFFGEIRDPVAALSVLQNSVNGWPIFATTHGASIEHTLHKYVSLCRQKDYDSAAVNTMLADALSAIVHLTMHESQVDGAMLRRVSASYLILDKDAHAARAKIADGDFKSLNDDIAAQRAMRGEL